MSPRSKLKLSLTVPLLALLIGCATAPSEPLPLPCGVLYTYGRDYQKAAGIELDAMKASGQYPHVIQMMEDYKTTRDTIRDCH